ncbi:MAG: hypothetical protein ACRDD1_16060, partial [Planctomycetia bacterium]
MMIGVGRPGLTVDEPINVGHGKRWVARVRDGGPGRCLDPAVVDSCWSAAHEHPPLARFLIGLAHAPLDPAPTDPSVYSCVLGRPASAAALAFAAALAVLLAGRLAVAAKLSPIVAGWSAGFAVTGMPRLFAHGRLASPEAISAAAVLAGVVAAAWAFTPVPSAEGRPPRVRLRRCVAAGVVLGLAMLTKLSAAVLPIGVVLAVLFFHGHRGLAPLVVWGTVGVATFVAGWPWLWPFDFPGYPPGFAGTLARMAEFASVGVNRATVYVWYFGKQYPNADGPVPWHFVWVFFAVTVPPAFHALGLFFGLPAMARLWRKSFPAVVATAVLGVTLGLFTLPVERYDGERLFLPAFPLWAVFVGLGAAAAVDILARVVPRWAAGVVVALAFATALVPLVRLDPLQLAYYSEIIGGASGAERLELEATYWGDSLTVELLDAFGDAAAPGDRAALLPTLYPGHAVRLASPKSAAKQASVVPGDLAKKLGCRWALVFNRAGYLHDPLPTWVMKNGAVT